MRTEKDYEAFLKAMKTAQTQEEITAALQLVPIDPTASKEVEDQHRSIMEQVQNLKRSRSARNIVDG